MEKQTFIESPKKWEGKVSSKLENAKADKIWPLFVDFFNINKWLPELTICRGVHGNNGEPGCIRYCTIGPVESPTAWVHERAIDFDHLNRTMVYEILDGTIGWESYVSTVKIIPDGSTGCVIDWSFSVNPVVACTVDDIVAQYRVWLDQLVLTMGQAVTQESG